MPTLFAPALRDFATQLFVATGAPPEEAHTVAAALVDANLAGHDSHGVLRIPEYVAWLEQKLITPGAPMTIVRETPAYALVDGGWNFGQVIGRKATELAIAKARQTGAATVAGRNTAHIGRCGDYPRIAADQGFCATLFVNTHGGGKLVAPFGGSDRRLSANPIAAGIPRNGAGSIVMDISTCAIAEGKLRQMLNAGKSAPEGAIIDAEGRPTTSPAAFYGPPAGALLPFGGHKGFALGLVSDILAGALSGGGCSNPNVTRIGNTFLLTVIDIDQVAEREEFNREVEQLIAYLKASPLAPGFTEILVPGEPELKEEARRSKTGIDIPEKIWDAISETARRYSVPLP